MVEAVNATGWNLIMEGKLVNAAFALFNTALGGWFVVGLFFIYQSMLYMKIKSPATNLITGLIYLGVYMNTEFFTWKFGGIIALINITFLTMVMYELIVSGRTKS